MLKRKVNNKMSENELLYALLKQKTGAVNPYDVFYFKVGQNSAGQEVKTYHLGGKKITDHHASQLRADAKMFKKTYLYKVFTETLENEAKLHMFEGMKTLEDMHYGKALLHASSLFEKVVDILDTMDLSTGNVGQ